MRSKIILLILSLAFTLFVTSCDLNITMPDIGGELEDSISEESIEVDESENTSNVETECSHERTEALAITVETCKNAGFYNTVCLSCGEIVGSFEKNQLSHTEGEWITVKTPEIEENGLEYTLCLSCGERIEREIDAIGYSRGLTFSSLGDGKCALVSRGSCTDSEVRVPPVSPDGETVIAIGDSAFEEDEGLVSIYIPDTVTVIGKDAFSLSALKNIRMSENVTLISDNAFFGCDLLEEIALPNILVEIGSNAFNSCRSLKEILLPDGLEFIGGGAFSNCNGVFEIHIPASVTYIGESAFSPKSIQNITVDEENAEYKIINNCLIDSDGLLIVGFGECDIPMGTIKIGRYAFIANSQMTSAKIPSTVREIGDFAFCMTGIEEIIIPYGLQIIGNGAFDGCEKLSSVIISNTVESIGYWAFESCIRLTSLQYYGSEEDWTNIVIHEDNEVLNALEITFIEEISPDSVYGYGRTTISGNAATLYDLIKVAVMSEIPEVTVKLNLEDKITIEDFNLARQIFLSDHPECFWWRGTVKYYHNTEGHISSLELSYDYSGEELVLMKAELETAVGEILRQLPDGSVFDKALYLHDMVAKTVTYEFTANDQTPYGALVEGKAVCNGYATSYQLLLQRAGIRAWTVNGTSNNQNHAWNVVWITEGVCVYTDVTWDDQTATIHYYFNMSLEEMDDDHFVSDDFILPECNHTEYGYDDLSTDCIVVQRTDSANLLIGRFTDLEDGGKAVSIYYMDSDFGSWLSANNRKIKLMTGGSSIYYTNFGNEYVIIVK